MYVSSDVLAGGAAKGGRAGGGVEREKRERARATGTLARTALDGPRTSAATGSEQRPWTCTVRLDRRPATEGA